MNTHPDTDDCACVQCPACASKQWSFVAFLGVLGRLWHFRCRYCDARWSEERDDDEGGL